MRRPVPLLQMARIQEPLMIPWGLKVPDVPAPHWMLRQNMTLALSEVIKARAIRECYAAQMREKATITPLETRHGIETR